MTRPEGAADRGQGLEARAPAVGDPELAEVARPGAPGIAAGPLVLGERPARALEVHAPGVG
jgi:hypothetical protein